MTPDLSIIKYSNRHRDFKDGTIASEDSHGFRIAQYKDCMMYEVPAINYRVESVINESEIINKMYPTKDTTFSYYIVRQNEQTGLMYDSLDAVRPKPFKVDSILHSLTINRENMAVFELDLGKPKIVLTDKKTNLITEERYFTKGPHDDSDSTYRYYNHALNDFNFSFAPSIDKQKKTKLYKTVFIFLNSEKKTKSEEITAIEEVNVPYRNKLIQLFHKFQKDKVSYSMK
ncbi:hypothetical protein D9M68_470930 [compost metagenome]